jgi:hypothetical protein
LRFKPKPIRKSFLFLFFKKEVLAFFLESFPEKLDKLPHKPAAVRLRFDIVQRASLARRPGEHAGSRRKRRP